MWEKDVLTVLEEDTLKLTACRAVSSPKVKMLRSYGTTDQLRAALEGLLMCTRDCAQGYYLQ